MNANTVVLVGCKLPWGLILEMGKQGEDAYTRVQIMGANGPTQGCNPPGALIVSGYGITPGVPEDFMVAWLKKHKSLDCVRNGLVFIESKPSDASAHATLLEGTPTGFERLNAAKPAKGIEPSEKEKA